MAEPSADRVQIDAGLKQVAILNANTPPSIRSGTFPGAKNSLMSLLNGNRGPRLMHLSALSV